MFEHLTDANGHNDEPHESYKAEVEPVSRVVHSCACESLDHLPHREAVGHILSVDCRRMGGRKSFTTGWFCLLYSSTLKELMVTLSTVEGSVNSLQVPHRVTYTSEPQCHYSTSIGD